MRLSVAALAMLVGSREVAADPSLDLPEAPSIRPSVVREDTPRPLHYRKPADTVRVLSRVALGLEMRSSEERDGGTAFAVDVFYGAALRFRRGGTQGLWTEAGYSYNRFHEHLLVVGAGPVLYHGQGGLASGMLKLALVPHVIAGSVDGSFGYGVRTSVIASFLCGLELAHQYLVVGDARIHEVHLMFTLPMGDM